MNAKLTYKQLKDQLDELYDFAAENQELYHNPLMFEQMLNTYNAIDNFIFNAFHDEDEGR